MIDTKQKKKAFYWDDTDEVEVETANGSNLSFSGVSAARRGKLKLDGRRNICTKDQAMRVLGIGVDVSESDGAKTVKYLLSSYILHSSFSQIPLSSYSQNDILNAFRQKIKDKVELKKSRTMAMQDVHESYQIVRRVQDAKKKFGNLGKGAVRQEKFTGIMGQVRQVKEFNFYFYSSLLSSKRWKRQQKPGESKWKKRRRRMTQKISGNTL